MKCNALGESDHRRAAAGGGGGGGGGGIVCSLAPKYLRSLSLARSLAHIPISPTELSRWAWFSQAFKTAAAIYLPL